MSGTSNNGFNLLAALAALLQGGQPSPSDILLMSEKFEPNPETEKTFKDALKDINEIDPSKVMGFFHDCRLPQRLHELRTLPRLRRVPRER